MQIVLPWVIAEFWIAGFSGDETHAGTSLLLDSEEVSRLTANVAFTFLMRTRRGNVTVTG